MKNLTKQNSLPGTNTTKLDNYKEWLQQKNFTKETIDKYLHTIKQYGNRSMVIEK